MSTVHVKIDMMYSIEGLSREDVEVLVWGLDCVRDSLEIDRLNICNGLTERIQKVISIPPQEEICNDEQ